MEVGTWKGGVGDSHGGAARERGASTPTILCIDTWLGALEFWTDQGRHDPLPQPPLEHGWPQVYLPVPRQRLSQRPAKAHRPFSPNFRHRRALAADLRHSEAELIYLDGSHEEEDVLRPILLAYWEVTLRCRGGVIFGDDWCVGRRPLRGGKIRERAAAEDPLRRRQMGASNRPPTA